MLTSMTIIYTKERGGPVQIWISCMLQQNTVKLAYHIISNQCGMETFWRETNICVKYLPVSITFGHVSKQEPIFVISNRIEIPKLTPFFSLFQPIIQFVLVCLLSSKESKWNNDALAKVTQYALTMPVQNDIMTFKTQLLFYCFILSWPDTILT